MLLLSDSCWYERPVVVLLLTWWVLQFFGEHVAISVTHGSQRVCQAAWIVLHVPLDVLRLLFHRETGPLQPHCDCCESELTTAAMKKQFPSHI